MESLIKDLRFAVRSLLRRPGVFAVATLSLALGIAANTTIFAALDAYLVQPLPYASPNDLARVFTTNPSRGWTRASSSVPDLEDWTREARGIQLAAWANGNYNLTAGDRTERVSGVRVTPAFFRVMGVAPSVGRTFLDAEGQRGGAHPVVLSDAFWRRRFAADWSVIGQTLLLDGTPHTVVGVMPPRFAYPRTTIDVWTPFVIAGDEARGSRFVSVIGRVRPGSTIDGAERELKAIADRLGATYKDDAGISARLVRLDHDIYDDSFRRGATISTVAVAFVLLIACANVANILLARATGRARELALRAALGAGRGRLIRQLLTESIVLALVGGGLGALLSVAGVRGFIAIVPPDFARTDTVAMNGRALLFTMALSVAAGLLFGTVPALQATAGSLDGTLREGGRGGTMGVRRNRLGASLVIAEIGLALALLVSAGLLIKASIQLRQRDLGFQPRGLLVMDVSLPESQYGDSARVVATERELLRRLREAPGVRSAGAVTTLPMMGATSTSYYIEGEPKPDAGKEPITAYRTATPGYLETMRIGLLAGRSFVEHEDFGAPRVVVVNEAFVRRHWPGKGVNPIGRRIVFTTAQGHVVRDIVGVVKDAREFGPENEPPVMIYVPAWQQAYRNLSFVLRTDGDPRALVANARAALAAVDPGLPAYNVRTMDELVEIATLSDHIMPRLLGAFGAVALLLAVIGVYGVMSYSASQRVQEVGVRMALGAQGGDIVRMIVGQGAVIAGVGLVIGLGLAALTTRGLGFFLFGVSAFDPIIFGGVTATLGAAAVVASVVPALRASRVDPVTALRAE